MHFLFITSQYYPKPSANGVCVDALVQELVKRGNMVDVVCYGEDYGKIEQVNSLMNIHTIRLVDSKIVNKLETLLSLPIYPVRSLRRVFDYVKVFNQVHKMSQIDCIIASQKPVETVYAASWIKRKHKNMLMFIYELDSISNDIEAKKGWRKLLHKKAIKEEKRFYNIADFIFHMECNRKHYEKKQYMIFQNKSFYLDIPLISEETYKYISNIKQKEKEKLIFLYSGVLMRNIRDPEYLIKLIAELSKTIICKCEFYTRGNCEDILAELAEKESEKYSANGYVTQENLFRAIAESDVLISIGNSFTEEIYAVPSKIFMYMSTCKPIIHILGGENDICKGYFEKYPAVLLIDPSESLSRNIESIKEFLIKTKSKKVDFEIVEKDLTFNTAKYSIDKILDKIHKMEH